MKRRDGFYRPVLGEPKDVTMQESVRPGMSVIDIPVFRNTIRRGTLRVKLASYLNGGLSIDTEHIKEPWEKVES